jgi:predicted Mrr-cat superfamily restriction endonuclease
MIFTNDDSHDQNLVKEFSDKDKIQKRLGKNIKELIKALKENYDKIKTEENKKIEMSDEIMSLLPKITVNIY